MIDGELLLDTDLPVFWQRAGPARWTEAQHGSRYTRPGVQFEIVGEIRVLDTIAYGHGVRSRRRLVRQYGRGKWRNMKGVAKIRLPDGTMIEAELHWYEAHGIGKKEIKFKKPISEGSWSVALLFELDAIFQ